MRLLLREGSEMPLLTESHPNLAVDSLKSSSGLGLKNDPCPNVLARDFAATFDHHSDLIFYHKNDLLFIHPLLWLECSIESQ